MVKKKKNDFREIEIEKEDSKISLNYKIIVSVLIFNMSFSVLLVMAYLLERSHFFIFLFEIGYTLIIALFFTIIMRYIAKSTYHFYLIVLLSLLSGYSALFASLMTKIIPILPSSDSLLVWVLLLIVMAGINIVSYLNLIFMIINKKLLEPLQNIIRNKRKTEEKLRDKKKELSLFNHIIAHDIKNYLTTIKGYAELYLMDKDKYDTIKRQVNQVLELLDNSLELAEAGKVIDDKKPVDLNKVIQEVVKNVVPENINVSIQSIPMVNGDRQKLTQAIKNILENAVIHGKPQNIKISSEIQDSGLTIRISDDGTKIPKEIIDYFDEDDYMVRLKQQYLGLKIIKRIVNAHGWNISIKNNPNTTYIIRIPKSVFKNEK